MTETEKASVPYAIREIPIADIIFPSSEMRTAVSLEGLDELARSIAQCGLMNPITVRMQGDKFELIAGYRRTKAHEMLNRLTVPARIFTSDSQLADIQKAHENLFREEVNPLDEGNYFKVLMEKHKWRLEDLAVSVHKSDGYVRRRIALLDMQDDVREALKYGKISVSMAEELGRIKDDAIRDRFIGLVINNGATVDVVRQWRIQHECSALYNPSATPGMSQGAEQSQSTDPSKIGDLKNYFGPTVELEEKATAYHICHSCICKVPADKAKLLIICPECAATIENALARAQATPSDA